MRTEHLEGDVSVIRREIPPSHRLSLLNHIFVERGTKDDWAKLHELHYKEANDGVGPRYWRALLALPGRAEELIGVIVFTVPKQLDACRNLAFPHLKPNQAGRDSTLQNRMRSIWVNKNIILSSRTVLDTMYRSAGIAYRFRNLAQRQIGYRFTESRSSMSRFNPFYTKAGMRVVQPKTATALEEGIQLFAKLFDAPAYDYVAILDELAAMPSALRERTLRQLRAFYYRRSAVEKSGEKRLLGTSRVDALDERTLLKQSMQLIFGMTIYAIWENPDHGRVLPERLPLTAFDNQGPCEPLRLDLL